MNISRKLAVFAEKNSFHLPVETVFYSSVSIIPEK